MSKFIDLTGQKFGRLTILGISGIRIQPCGAKTKIWKCICECGNECLVRSYHLKNGHTKSCGCYQKEATSKVVRKHGMRRTYIYNIWDNIKQRCENPNNPAYHNYGGRGIMINAKWRNDFNSFYDNVSNLPHFGESGYTLDRINNDKGYNADNVRWATQKEQNNNKRNVKLITYNGKSQTMVQWAKELGIRYDTLKARINRYNWGIERALGGGINGVQRY